MKIYLECNNPFNQPNWICPACNYTPPLIADHLAFAPLILPLMLLSRSISRSKTQNYDPLSELKISGFLNFMLEKILDFERFLVRLGCSFPLGGSLLAIAYKK